MQGFKISYLVAVLLTFALNGIALLQHIAALPAHAGFIAAVLVLNMLAMPVVLWIAFVYGEIAASRLLGRHSGRPLASR